jgi:hypothetical protein
LRSALSSCEAFLHLLQQLGVIDAVGIVVLDVAVLVVGDDHAPALGDIGLTPAGTIMPRLSVPGGLPQASSRRAESAGRGSGNSPAGRGSRCRRAGRSCLAGNVARRQGAVSDEFEGRGPNTAGEDQDRRLPDQPVQAAGLKPGGDLVDGKRGWTQDVPLGRFEIKGPVELTLKGGGKRASADPGRADRRARRDERREAASTSRMRRWCSSATASRAGAQVGRLQGPDLKGKLAVVLINDPDFETGKGDFGGKAMTYYGRWTYKFEEMARRGALGTIIVHENRAGFLRLGDGQEFEHQRHVRHRAQAAGQGARADGSVDPARPRRRPVQARRPRFRGKLKKLAQTRSFKPVELKGVTLSASYAVDAQVITSKNVIAVRDRAASIRTST